MELIPRDQNDRPGNIRPPENDCFCNSVETDGKKSVDADGKKNWFDGMLETSIKRDGWPDRYLQPVRYAGKP